MLRDFYFFEHALNLFGHDELHFYDIPVLVLLLLFIIGIITHMVRHNKREKDFEKEQEEMLNNQENEEIKESEPVESEGGA